jgi:replicative DNA helicase
VKLLNAPSRARTHLSVEDIQNFESVLITRILETKDIKTPVKRKITADFFFQPETRAAFSFLISHYQEYGTTPSLALFRNEFEDFDFHSTSDTVQSLCDRVRDDKLYRDLVKMVEEGVRLVREDPRDGLDFFRSNVASLTSQHVVTRDVDVARTAQETLAEYLRVKEGHGMLGIPWPWAKMNEVTLGIQRQELIFFYARPKSLKTWLLLLCAVYCFEHGRRPLVITTEMPTDQIRRRTAAIWARVNYNDVRRGKLSPFDEQKYRDDLEAMAEVSVPLIITGNDDDDKGMGVMSLSTKIDEYEPDILFVDGVYLLRDDRGGRKSTDWQGQAHIVQDLKSLAFRTDIPIVGTTQANRSGDKSKGNSNTEMAFSDAYLQSADYVIRSIYDQKEKESNEAILTMPGVREAPGCTFTVNAHIANDMSQKWVADSQEDADEVLAGTDEDAVMS